MARALLLLLGLAAATGHAQGASPEPLAPGPRLITVELTGSTTWRTYCSRPGVTSCRAYDALDEPARPTGQTATFAPQVPYFGGAVSAELFPFWRSTSAARGLGVRALYAQGSALAAVRVRSPTSATPERELIAVDQEVEALALYRWYFVFGPDRFDAHVGARAGLGFHGFAVDPAPEVPLPSPRRVYPLLGVETALPLGRLITFHAGASLFLDPAPGQQLAEDFGSPARGRGFVVDVGATGDIWGPLGYVVRFRYEGFADTFGDGGTRWTRGGAAEEGYAVLRWGLSLHW